MELNNSSLFLKYRNHGIRDIKTANLGGCHYKNYSTPQVAMRKNKFDQFPFFEEPKNLEIPPLYKSVVQRK